MCCRCVYVHACVCVCMDIFMHACTHVLSIYVDNIMLLCHAFHFVSVMLQAGIS